MKTSRKASRALPALFCVACLLFPMTAAATDSAPATITKVRFSEVHDVLIYIDGADGCAGGENIIISDDSASTDAILRLALAAYLSGRKVVARYGTCNQDNRLVSNDLTLVD